ncbi:ATP-grasp domain-containing protein [Priestia aryabhattai]|uniref:ATP-grasp domain-containing protein n=1 Tax=Priestia aryabhattai TaxID=412384 RepID=UPI002452D8FF|nr:ATP-grasp domain-containing protein [Priestia aryabhattai]MDH3135453.1 ATP-grasp domain-containing protein [Priestia aryabhattai]
MNECSKKKLLIVDAPGGPPPSKYLKMLPSWIEVSILCVLTNNSEKARHRIKPIQDFGCYYKLLENRLMLKKVLKNMAKSLNVEGILAFSERVVHDTNEVARELNLPSNSNKTQAALSNKELQRSLLKKADMRVPEVHKINKLEDIELNVNSFTFPAILKPIYGIGSLGVQEIESINQLKTAYHKGKTLHEEDERIQKDAEFILESKIIGEKWNDDKRLGDHVSVESLISQSEINHLVITDKFPLAYPFRETGDIMPSSLNNYNQDLIFNEATKGIKALGIEHGAVHTEIKLTRDGPVIIEINGRIGGGITEMLDYSADYNVIEDLCFLAIGEKNYKELKFKGYSAFFTPQPPPFGIQLTNVPNIDILLSESLVKEAKLEFLLGDQPNWQIGTGSNLARIITYSDNKEDLMELSKSLLNLELFEYKEV